jgi:hypothetical protein
MPEIVIPSGGITDDQTPEIRVLVTGPLGAGASIHIVRNAVDIGQATALSLTEYSFTDNVAPGIYSYVAEIWDQQNIIPSPPYVIEVVSNEEPPVYESDFFSSVLYGYLSVDDLSVGVPEPGEGLLNLSVGVPEPGESISINFSIDNLDIGVPGIEDGTLEETIGFPEVRPLPDTIAISLVPSITGGTLDEVINSQEFSHELDILSINNVPSIVGGTLQVVISYVNYAYDHDTLSTSVPAISSGTLL